MTVAVTYSRLEVVEAEVITSVVRTKARVAAQSAAFCSDQSTNVWFPIAPGTTLPTPPASTANENPAPANSVPVPPDFDPTDTCYIFQDLLPINTAPVYAEELEPAGIVEPYTETVPLLGITVAGLSIREYPYELTLPGESIAAVIRTIIQIPTYQLSLEAAAFTTTGQAASLKQNRKVIGAAGVFTLTGVASSFIRNYVVAGAAGSYALDGQDATLVYQRNPLAGEAGAFVLQGQDVEFFFGKTLFADAGSFAVSGETAGLSQPERVAAGEAGSFATTGQSANLTYISPTFAVVTYTGNGTTTNAVTGVGFQPGLIWTKALAGGHTQLMANGWSIDGSERLFNASETGNNSAVNVFDGDSDGFTLKSANANANTTNYIAWCLKGSETPASNTDGTITTNVSSSAASGISSFSYTGNGTAGATIGHGIAAGAPDIVFIKQINVTRAGVASFTAILPNQLATNSTSQKGTDTIVNSLDSTTISLGSDSSVNGSGGLYIGFAVKSKTGFSKVGTFTGNGSSTQTVTGLGFAPAFVMVKSYLSTTSNWVIFTKDRDSRFFMNDTSAEQTTDFITFDADGFTLESGASVNTNLASYVYMAFG